jgi:hypothetical protein
VKIQIADRVYRLSKRDDQKLLDYCRRLGIEPLAARIEQLGTEPEELTEEERRDLREAIDRLWPERRNIQPLRNALDPD